MSQPIEDALVSEAGSGMALPLLPTLIVALIVSAGSFLCQSPSVPVPEQPVSVSVVETNDRQASADALEATTAFVPAAVAFREQFPLHDDVALMAEARAEARRAVPRVAAAKPSARRPEAARSEIAKADGVKVDGIRPDAVRAASSIAARAPAASEPFKVEAASEGGLIPDLAIPFAPAISALTRAGSFVGTQGAVAGAQVVALGNVVTSLVDRLPLRP